MRVSIESGSLRVTTTRGFFLKDMSCSHEIVQTSLTRVFDTAGAAGPGIFVGFPIAPFRHCEGLGRVLVVPVLSSRRPRQDKNSGAPRVGGIRGRPGRGTGVG